jgi:hypothetical protein
LIRPITNPSEGIVGYLHELSISHDTILVFQLPRKTDMLSDTYIQGALKSVKECIPEGKKAIVIGADVDIYTIAGEDAVVLKLKGLI